MSYKIYTPIPREDISRAILYVLRQDGKTIGSLSKKHSKIHDNNSQVAREELLPAWHKLEEIRLSVAKMLRIDPSLYGPYKVSNTFYIRMRQELDKLEKKGMLVRWKGTKNQHAFKLVQKSGLNITKPGMTPLEDIVTTPAQTEVTDEKMKRIFVSIMASGKKDNTYKFALAKILLDYCKNTMSADKTAQKIPYRYLAKEFLRHYWHQEYVFKMKQDFKITKSPLVIQSIREVFKNRPPPNFDLLDKQDIEAATEKILKTVFGHARKGTSMVVPRFQNIPGSGGNEEHRIFYEYSDDAQAIQLSSHAFNFFKNNHAILSGYLLSEWAKFLEKTNSSMPRLVEKIGIPNKKRGSLAEFRNIYSEHTDCCFYCGNRLETDFTQVDHFIPWSYIFDDDAWNLVLACSDCNCKKSDCIPQADFKSELIKRNNTYRETIPKLQLSLKQLNMGRGWELEIENHYDTCIQYGFGRIRMP